MLIAYILSSARLLRIKVITARHRGSVFKKGDVEYSINPDYQYQKKFLGFKTFFFSLYYEGNPNPLKITKSGIESVDDVPLSEMSYIAGKVVRSKNDKIFMVLLALTLFVTLVVAGKVYGFIN